jgi:hypothetical protein
LRHRQCEFNPGSALQLGKSLFSWQRTGRERTRRGEAATEERGIYAASAHGYRETLVLTEINNIGRRSGMNAALRKIFDTIQVAGICPECVGEQRAAVERARCAGKIKPAAH